MPTPVNLSRNLMRLSERVDAFFLEIWGLIDFVVDVKEIIIYHLEHKNQ
jgi:hypothetical protein